MLLIARGNKIGLVYLVTLEIFRWRYVCYSRRVWPVTCHMLWRISNGEIKGSHQFFSWCKPSPIQCNQHSPQGRSFNEGYLCFSQRKLNLIHGSLWKMKRNSQKLGIGWKMTRLMDQKKFISKKLYTMF